MGSAASPFAGGAGDVVASMLGAEVDEEASMIRCSCALEAAGNAVAEVERTDATVKKNLGMLSWWFKK